MKFKSSTDNLVILISLFVISMTIYFFFIEVAAFKRLLGLSFISFLFTFKLTIILLATLSFSYCLSVKSYFLSDKEVVIKKRLGIKIISFNEIESIKRTSHLKAYIRLFGVGGLFGYNGIYLASSKIIYLYTSHKGNLIKINRCNKPAVYISPDNAKLFVTICQTKNLKVLDKD